MMVKLRHEVRELGYYTGEYNRGETAATALATDKYRIKDAGS